MVVLSHGGYEKFSRVPGRCADLEQRRTKLEPPVSQNYVSAVKKNPPRRDNVLAVNNRPSPLVHSHKMAIEIKSGLHYEKHKFTIFRNYCLSLN